MSRPIDDENAAHQLKLLTHHAREKNCEQVISVIDDSS